MIICGIYCIKNIVNNKIYIGQSVDINARFRHHKSELKHNKHINSHLQNSWNNHKPKDFVFSVLETCDCEQLNEKEIYWIKYYNSNNQEYGYNQTSGGAAVSEYKHTEEAKERMSKYWTGKMIGEDNPRSVLKESDVMEIINMLCESINMVEISKHFNVTKSTINMIKRKEIWTHLTSNIEFPVRNPASKYKGVFKNKKNNKYTCCISCNHNKYYLGSFETEIEAAVAYNNKLIELSGDMNKLNKIP